MLNENIEAIRKSKGLSQQELAIKLNVVRQKGGISVHFNFADKLRKPPF